MGAVLCAVGYKEPKGYVIPRSYTDWIDKSSVYLENADDPAYAGYRIMNYRDADTPMQIVEGNVVTLETARYYVGSILIGGLAGYLICVGSLLPADKKK